MYGGIDYTKQYVNNATRRDYQVGSTFKPFVFTSAVAERLHHPGRPPDHPEHRLRRHQQARGDRAGTARTGYAPANEDDRSYGQITVPTATDKSVNAVYAQMAVDVGPAKVKADRRRPRHPRRTPPTSPPSAVHRARHRHRQRPRHGRGLRDPRQPRQARHVHPGRQGHQGRRGRRPARARAASQAVTREAADTTTSILQSVVDGGTGTAAQAAGPPGRRQDRHRRGGQGGLVRGLHPRPRHRRRRAWARTRRPARRSRCTAPLGLARDQRRRLPRARSGPSTPRPR